MMVAVVSAKKNKQFSERFAQVLVRISRTMICAVTEFLYIKRDSPKRFKGINSSTVFGSDVFAESTEYFKGFGIIPPAGTSALQVFNKDSFRILKWFGICY